MFAIVICLMLLTYTLTEYSLFKYICYTNNKKTLGVLLLINFTEELLV